MKKAFLDTAQSPAGGLTFAVDEEGGLLRVEFLDGTHAGPLEEELVRDGWTVVEDSTRTANVRVQLEEYTAGARQAFDLPIAPQGTDWQKAVWLELSRIPYGETRSYGQIAEEMGRPGAARAVGRANATNPIPVIVPCHRVIGANGSLTGFGGGLHLKTALLAHEAEVSTRRDQ